MLELITDKDGNEQLYDHEYDMWIDEFEDTPDDFMGVRKYTVDSLELMQVTKRGNYDLVIPLFVWYNITVNGRSATNRKETREGATL